MKTLIGLLTVGILAATAPAIHTPPTRPTEWQQVCNEVDEALTEGWYVGEEARAAMMLLDVCIERQKGRQQDGN